MIQTRLSVLTGVLIAAALTIPASATSEMTIEDREICQRAIDRVYYTNQVGVTRPFDRAVPFTVQEDKVRKYLKQTVALERFWATPVTDRMLEREMERMASGTRMPGRLKELYAVLDDDPVRIQECLARPLLVDRLARSFFAADDRIHAAARRQAEDLRTYLASGPVAEDPSALHSFEVIFLRAEPDGLGSDSSIRILPSDDFDARLRRLQSDPAGIGPVEEHPTGFSIDRLLQAGSGSFRVARYRIPKRQWEDWWSAVEGGLDEHSVGTVASASIALPDPGRSESRSGEPCLEDDTWLPVTADAIPTARKNHVAVWTGSLMLIWGGTDNLWDDSGGRYDPATDTWTLMSTYLKPEEGINQQAVWTGSLMLVWGGKSNTGGYIQLGRKYDPIADSWSYLPQTGQPNPRELHTAVWTGTEMLIWGGRDYDVHYNDGGAFNMDTYTWRPLSTAGAPVARENHTAVWTGTEMIVWGGSNSTLGTLFDDGGRYRPDTDSWSPTSTGGKCPTPRNLHTAIWTGSEMVVWGGNYGAGSYNTGGRYDPLTDSWRSTNKGQAPEGRARHTAVWSGTEMIVWGGDDLNSGSRYDPITDSWTDTNSLNAPIDRFDHSAVWTGDLMLIFGGQSIGADRDRMADGSRYDPASDTWTPMGYAQPPEGRTGGTAVWTGSEMIVWGGVGEYSTLQNGARYDLATDSWRPTSLTNAPMIRTRHSAVWAGDAMLIWGGHEGMAMLRVYYDDGGRYDPISDSWALIPDKLGCPTARSRHTAIWTGTEMIIWGGEEDPTGPVYLATGGRYDPADESWTATSLTGSPQARVDHTAVWTGESMLIWGGFVGGSQYVVNTGAGYDPATDSWQAMSVVDAPARRRVHTAVWAGNEMIVWGGIAQIVTSLEFQDTGGRYDPIADTWTATPLDGAPMERAYHTAVWTGADMVVWGGLTSGEFKLRTGGRYDPAGDSWSDTTRVNAPTSRNDHLALWTGEEMIVWGGEDNDGLSRAGGLYGSGPPADRDLDGAGCNVDCDDDDDQVWSLPGEAVDLVLAGDKQTLTWTGPAEPGGVALVYDTLRSESAGDFVSAAVCIESDDGSDTQALDADTPPPGVVFHYLVRGGNACGDGSLGVETGGTERSGRDCP